jgi:putative ABC transport system permease protein
MFALAFTLLRRELAQSEARVLLLALALAVASVGSVALFANQVKTKLSEQASALLGADLMVVSDKPVSAGFSAQALESKLKVTDSVRFLSMVNSTNAQQTDPVLTDVKAVQAAYPLRGTIQTETKANLKGVPGSGEVWIDTRLQEKLKVQIGDRLQVGQLSAKLTQVFAEEPEIAGSFVTLSPKLLMNHADLGTTDLLQAGNRASYRLHVAGNPSDTSRYLAWLKPQLTSGTRVDTVSELRPEVRNTLQRAEQFLSLTALLAVLLAAVAVVLSTRRYVQRELDNMALMRCLGASRLQLLQLLAMQFVLLLILAVGLGVILALIGQAILVSVFTFQ